MKHIVEIVIVIAVIAVIVAVAYSFQTCLREGGQMMRTMTGALECVK